MPVAFGMTQIVMQCPFFTLFSLLAIAWLRVIVKPVIKHTNGSPHVIGDARMTVGTLTHGPNGPVLLVAGSRLRSEADGSLGHDGIFEAQALDGRCWVFVCVESAVGGVVGGGVGLVPLSFGRHGWCFVLVVLFLLPLHSAMSSSSQFVLMNIFRCGVVAGFQLPFQRWSY